MNTTLTIRTNSKVKKNFSLYAQSRGLTLSAMLNNIMITKPNEDLDKHMQVEDMTLDDFISYKRAMENFKNGKFTRFEDYHKKRMQKISATSK